MSHMIRIQMQVRDALAVRSARRRLGLAAPVEGEAKLYRQTATGPQVQLRDWK